MQGELPKGYLLLHNIGKKNNIGNIVRTACAFGIQKVLYVSKDPQARKSKLLKQFHLFGNQGTYKKIQYQAFASLSNLKAFLVENNISVCGVEIGEGSIAIEKHPFRGHTAFFLGNEGTGILPQHKYLCDYFVYIRQYTDKTASLNVSVAAGIIFHHFGLWAGYEEAAVYGEKFKLQQQDQQVEKQVKQLLQSKLDNEHRQDQMK